MFKDRGSIKWVSLMLPEHVKMLREWKDEAKTDVKTPIFEEDQLEEMNRIFQEALSQDLPLSLDVKGDPEPRTFIGKIKRVDPITKTLRVQLLDSQMVTIQVQDLLHLSICEAF